MEGQKARVALGAVATGGSGTGSIRAKTSRSVGRCGQRCGRLEPLFKRPTRACGNKGSNSCGNTSAAVHPIITPRSPGRSATGSSTAKAFAASVATPGCPAGRQFSAGSPATRNFACSSARLPLPCFLVGIDQGAGPGLGWPDDRLRGAVTKLIEVVGLRVLDLCPKHA
jgi:hypothetical protein